MFTTSNLREIRDLISQWFSSVNTSLPEAVAVWAAAMAVYEASYMAKLFGAKINKPDGEKLFTAAKQSALGWWEHWLMIFYQDFAENARQKVE